MTDSDPNGAEPGPSTWQTRDELIVNVICPTAEEERALLQEWFDRVTFHPPHVDGVIPPFPDDGDDDLEDLSLDLPEGQSRTPPTETSESGISGDRKAPYPSRRKKYPSRITK